LENQTEIKQWNLHGTLILTKDNIDYHWARFTPLPCPWKNEKQYIATSGSCWIMNDTILLSSRMDSNQTIAIGKDDPQVKIITRSPKWKQTKYCVLFNWEGKVSELKECATGKPVTDKDVIAAIMPQIVTFVKKLTVDVPTLTQVQNEICPKCQFKNPTCEPMMKTHTDEGISFFCRGMHQYFTK
jgi:hypothetical protein